MNASKPSEHPPDRAEKEKMPKLFLGGNCFDSCVCVFSAHSFWTSSSLDVPAGVTQQEEGHTGFLIHLLSAVRALIFLARRIQPFLSLVDREVEFCVLTGVRHIPVKNRTYEWIVLGSL